MHGLDRLLEDVDFFADALLGEVIAEIGEAVFVEAVVVGVFFLSEG